MSLVTEEVLSKNTRQYAFYKELGYKEEKSGGFLIKPEHMLPGSHQEVLVQCDSGKNIKCLGIFNREWRSYLKCTRGNNIDFCTFCTKTELFTGRGNPNTKYFFDDNYLETIDTPEKAYLLGWIASDGSLAADGRICINIRDYDIEVLFKLKRYLCKELPISEHKGNMVSLTINSTKMMKDCLKHLGLLSAGEKASLVQYPHSIPRNLDVYFIRGYFDGDGSVCVKHGIPSANISSKSIQILKDIQYLSGFGSVYECANGENKWETTSGNKSIEFLEYLYRDISVSYLERKFNKFCQLQDWKPSLSGMGTSTKLNTTNGIIKFNKSNKNAILPTITDPHASGIDLHIIEKVKTFTKDVDLYTTGIKVKPPEGFYFILVGRSSISKSGYSLANGIGIIDENYIGEILVPLRKHTEEELVLPSRLVQLVLVPKINCTYTVVDSLEDTERGCGGFGSTG